jgi:hypothetical protein
MYSHTPHHLFQPERKAEIPYIFQVEANLVADIQENPPTRTRHANTHKSASNKQKIN